VVLRDGFDQRGDLDRGAHHHREERKLLMIHVVYKG
jgi:hypothetical protein